MTHEWMVKELGLNFVGFMSGAIGGTFSLKWVEELNWWGKATTILFGAMVANYATLPVYNVFKIEGLHQGAIGLLIGMFAISITASLYKALAAMRLEEILTNAARSIANFVTRTNGSKP